MKQLRKYIRTLIIEDAESFYHDYKKMFTDAGYSKASGRTIRFTKKGQGQTIKDLWRQHADHKWFANNVDTIHFQEDPDRLLNWGRSKRKDEVSCTMHLKNQEIQSPILYGGDARFGSIGLMFKGRITLAVNDMDFAMTGYRDRYTPEFGNVKSRDEYRHREASSGINKYPMSGPNVINPQGWNVEAPYIFGKEDFDASQAVHNEALVDNWKIVAIVAMREDIEFAIRNPDSDRDASLLYELYYKFQVPIIDENRNDLTEKFLA